MRIDGSVLIGAEIAPREVGFVARNAATGAELPIRFARSSAADVARACALAETAADAFAESAPADRAAFLETIGEELAALGDALIDRASAETGLPRARLEGERARTIGQLRLFADIVREGAWVDATIDRALPDRRPAPRPDLRRRNVALGPVAVFGASNFPLAFSVAGGDTASAFAAGCPVVVKGHSAHPGTGELAARAIRAAVVRCGLPDGVFSFLPGDEDALGAALVADPRIRAVGFTGGRAGGMALTAIAAARAETIPVFAEMSSVNPVVLAPKALAERADALGAAWVASLTLGAGQFCTNPGLVVAIDGPDLDRFLAAAAAAVKASTAGQMLTPAIHRRFGEGTAAFAAHGRVTAVASGLDPQGPCEARAAIFSVTAATFHADASLAEEVFGAAGLVVRCVDWEEAEAVLAGLEGQLTATLHMHGPEDEAIGRRLLPLLQRKAGRILAGGWPTGVEVGHAMVHGGPFPATSDGRSTSVGALAIMRFLRPVCYQDLSQALLPSALRDDNPFGLARRIDGVMEPPARS